MPTWEHRVLAAGVDYGYHSAVERDKAESKNRPRTASLIPRATEAPQTPNAREIADLPVLEAVLNDAGREGWEVVGMSALAVILRRSGDR